MTTILSNTSILSSLPPLKNQLMGISMQIHGQENVSFHRHYQETE